MRKAFSLGAAALLSFLLPGAASAQNLSFKVPLADITTRAMTCPGAASVDLNVDGSDTTSDHVSGFRDGGAGIRFYFPGTVGKGIYTVDVYDRDDVLVDYHSISTVSGLVTAWIELVDVGDPRAGTSRKEQDLFVHYVSANGRYDANLAGVGGRIVFTSRGKAAPELLFEGYDFNASGFATFQYTGGQTCSGRGAVEVDVPFVVTP